MKDLKEMERTITQKLENKLREVEDIQNKITTQMWKDTKENAPNIRHDYISSIEKTKVEIKDGVYISSVYSNLRVGGNIPKWVDVPLSAFAEWGTGPLGQDTNTYQHGYPYTTNQPWDSNTYAQYMDIGTWGTIARPHFYPSLQKAIPTFKEEIGKALKKWEH